MQREASTNVEFSRCANVFSFEQTSQAPTCQTPHAKKWRAQRPFDSCSLDGNLDGNQRRKQMNPSTKDEIKGNFHEVKGKVKEKAGQVTNNRDLEAEGSAERNVGKVQKKVGQIEKVLGK
jgi:uncharacterized protein YjbJ (UPF0337 family)